ncbi:MAG TPA: hypothetical protein VFV63_08270 [Ilumatobacteraceae bacterium]|nr:hypothetical protein [Ilumatobacteraceae bacterium]
MTSSPRQLDRPITALAATTDGLLTAHPDGTLTSSNGTSIDLTPGTADADTEVVALFVDDVGVAP